MGPSLSPCTQSQFENFSRALLSFQATTFNIATMWQSVQSKWWSLVTIFSGPANDINLTSKRRVRLSQQLSRVTSSECLFVFDQLGKNEYNKRLVSTIRNYSKYCIALQPYKKDKDRREGKGCRCCLGDIINLILCRTRYFHQDDFIEKDELN